MLDKANPQLPVEAFPLGPQGALVPFGFTTAFICLENSLRLFAIIWSEPLLESPSATPSHHATQTLV